MKSILRTILSLSIVCILFFASCRKEEMELVEPPEDETLVINSPIVNLIKLTVSNDGSVDNIIDQANCFDIEFPVTVLANGTEVLVVSEEDFISVEDIFDEFDDDEDSLEILFPITITFGDYSQTVVADYPELYSFSGTCNGENIMDDDIECLDFQYPITASIFNSNNEKIDTETLNDDKSLYLFVEGIDQYDIVTMDFPIAVLLPNEASLNIDNLNELRSIIEANINACDEDDDNNYDDDDCNSCTTNQLTTFLTSCPDWTVDQLERDNSPNTEAYYDGYVFNFFTDGTVVSQFSVWEYSGTWTASGTANNITVIINIPSLPECNNNWILHEIEENPDGTKVSFRLGDEELRYVNDCM